MGDPIANLDELDTGKLDRIPEQIGDSIEILYTRTGDNLIYVDNPEHMNIISIPVSGAPGYFIGVDLEEGEKYSVENYTNVYMSGTLGVLIQNTQSAEGYIDIYHKALGDLPSRLDEDEYPDPNVRSAIHQKMKCENAVKVNSEFRQGLNEDAPIEKNCVIPGNGVKTIFFKHYDHRSANARLKFLCKSSGLIAKVFIIEGSKSESELNKFSSEPGKMARLKAEPDPASFTTAFFEYDTLLGTVNVFEGAKFYAPGANTERQSIEGRGEINTPYNNNEYSTLTEHMHEGKLEKYFGGNGFGGHRENDVELSGKKIHYGNFGMLYHIKLIGDIEGKLLRAFLLNQAGCHIINTAGKWYEMPFMESLAPYTFDPKDNEFQYVFCGANAAPVEFEVVDGLKTRIEFTIGSRVMRVNDASVNLHEAPYIENGYTMVPVRAAAEHMVGVQNIEWDGTAKQIKITNGSKQAIMVIGSKTLIIKDSQTDETTVETLDVAPYIKNGYSFIPFRTFGEKILRLSSDKISWNPVTKTARFN